MTKIGNKIETQRNAPKKNGLVLVMCRVTVNGKVSQFNCKLDVEEKSWNVELGRLSGRSIVAQVELTYHGFFI